MNMRVAALAMVALSTLFSSLPAQAILSPLPRKIVPDCLGVNIHFTDPRPGEMKMLAAAGFRWVRMDFNWGGIEKVKGQYDFSAYDRLLDALAPYHIRALFILDYNNKFYDNGESPHSEEARQAFARWAAAAVTHFKGRGILWEMYNEPNGGFWHPRSDVTQYIPLALAVGKAIRKAEPEETYIGPATSGLDFPFLTACFKAGLLEYWRAVSVHPYRGTGPETAASEFRRLRLLIERYAPAGKHIPIISGEWGYSSIGGLSEDMQGRLLARQWLSNMANGIALSIWYDWHDDGLDPKYNEHNFGTVENPYLQNQRPVYKPKPAYLAARTLTTFLSGLRFNKRLWLGDSSDYALLFTRGKETRLAVWSTTPKEHTIIIPASAGVFNVVSNTGDALPAISAGGDGLKVSVTDAPQYLAPQTPNELLQVAGAIDPAPLEALATPKRPASFAVGMKNPLNHTLVVTAPSSQFTIKPGTSRNATMALTYDALLKAGSPETVTLKWVIGGLGAITQQTVAIANSAVSLLAMAPSADSMIVDVHSLSTAPISGRIALSVVSDGQTSHGSQTVHIPQGADDTQVKVPVAIANPADCTVQGAFSDNLGQLQATLPPVHIQRIDDFARFTAGQAPDGYRVVADGDAKVASRLALSAGIPTDGPASPGLAAIRLSYEFDPGWKFARVTPPAGRQAILGKPREFGIWVYGDGQGGSPRLRFADSTGQVFQPAAPDITWKGWRYVMFPMDAGGNWHWGGANDGVIHYPIHWDTLFLIDNPSRTALKGDIYLAGPTLME